MESIFISGLFTILAIIITYFVSVRKSNKEILKMSEEIKVLKADKEAKELKTLTDISNFYEEQTKKLLKKVNELNTKIDNLTDEVVKLKILVNDKNEEIIQLKSILKLANLCDIEPDLCPVIQKRVIKTKQIKKD